MEPEWRPSSRAPANTTIDRHCGDASYRYRNADYARSIAAKLYGVRLRDEPELARTLLHEHSRVGSRHGYQLQLLAGVGWTSLPGLPFIRQSTLILAGSGDPIISLVSARIMARLVRTPHCRCTTTDTWSWSPRHTNWPVVTDFLLS